mgnify:CR=1 FL=1
MVHHVVFRDGAFHDVLHAGDLIHDFLHDLLDDRAKAAGAGIALDSLAGDRSTPSMASSFLYCLTRAFFGSVRILTRASSFSG